MQFAAVTITMATVKRVVIAMAEALTTATCVTLQAGVFAQCAMVPVKSFTVTATRKSVNIAMVKENSNAATAQGDNGNVQYVTAAAWPAKNPNSKPIIYHPVLSNETG